MFVLGLLISAAYWPGLISPAIAPRWAVLSIVAPALLLWRWEAIPFTRAHLTGLVLVLWSGVSVLWSPQPLDSIDAFWQTAVLPAVCFCLGSQRGSLRPLFIGAAIGLGLSSAVAIGQVLGWHALPEIASPSGLFVNRNLLAEAAALVMVGLISCRLWWPVALVMPALVLPESRGALIAVSVPLVAYFMRRPAALSLIAGAALAGLATITLGKGMSGITERLDIWAATVQQFSWFGSGIGSFWAIHPEHYLEGVAIHAHNDFLELASDLGVVGLALFGWLVWELRGPLGTYRLVLIALAIEACFAFPLHMPVTLAIGAVCAGNAIHNRSLVRGISLRGRGAFQESMA